MVTNDLIGSFGNCMIRHDEGSEAFYISVANINKVNCDGTFSKTWHFRNVEFSEFSWDRVTIMANSGLTPKTNLFCLSGFPFSRENESERWLQLALEAAQMAAYQQDLKTQVVVRSYTPATGSFIDPKKEHWTFTDALLGIYAEDRKTVQEQIEQAIQSRTDFSVEFRMKLANGDFRWVQSKGQALYDCDGTPCQLLSVAQDITERKNAETRLQQKAHELAVAKERLALTLNLAGMVAIPGISAESSFKSTELSRMFAAPDDLDWSTNVLLSRVVPEDRATLVKQIELNKINLGQFEHEFRVQFPDGSQKWMMSRGARVRQNQDESQSYIVIQDIHRLKENEKQIEQKSAALANINSKLERFSSIVAHDLKGPLNSISMAAELLTEATTKEEIGELAQFIRQGAGRMANLINDLLAFAKTENEREMFEEAVSLEEIFETVCANLKANIQSSQASIECLTALPTVTGSRPQLLQLFQNLISNALKFRREPTPKILISSEKLGNFWQISVQDNGVGINATHLSQIFEPFRRFHADRFEGTGLGLSICKKIVEQHGGKLSVESEPEKGTKFHFTLKCFTPPLGQLAE